MEFNCPHCQVLMQDDGSMAGQLAQCPQCWAQFYVPGQPSYIIPEDVKDDFAQPTSNEHQFTYVTISQNGHITANFRNVREARFALQELRLLKKQLALMKREAKQQQQATRANYTDQIRRRGSKFIGGGKIGQIIRAVQTISRDHVRGQLANSLAPLDQQVQKIASMQLAVDYLILQVDKYIVFNA